MLRADEGGLPKVVVPKYYNAYDSVEFTLATAQSDYNIKVNELTSFNAVPYAHCLMIRTNQTISIKLNSASNSAITIDVSEGSLVITRDTAIEITNIFVTNNSGSSAAVKILLFP